MHILFTLYISASPFLCNKMAFLSPTFPLRYSTSIPFTCPHTTPHHPKPSFPRASLRSESDVSRIPESTLPAPIYGAEDDVCTFGAECELSPECVSSSPAVERLASKYVLPMREHHTQVFFDHASTHGSTCAIVFAEDRHGLVLDVVSVLKALSIRVHRVASGENESLRLLLNRIEGELVSVRGLNLSLHNCFAFWITDEESGRPIFGDGDRLAQISECIKIELNSPYPRPRASHEAGWHRVCIQKNRADRYTVFSLQTNDKPGLLAQITSAFKDVGIDVASANIKTLSERVENHFFVTKQGFKEPLKHGDIESALEAVMKALLAVGDTADSETLWYQVRDGTAMLIAEAIFIDEVNNSELSCFKFGQFETPNFRGRLPEAPYRPILLD